MAEWTYALKRDGRCTGKGIWVDRRGWGCSDRQSQEVTHPQLTPLTHPPTLSSTLTPPRDPACRMGPRLDDKRFRGRLSEENEWAWTTSGIPVSPHTQRGAVILMLLTAVLWLVQVRVGAGIGFRVRMKASRGRAATQGRSGGRKMLVEQATPSDSHPSCQIPGLVGVSHQRPYILTGAVLAFVGMAAFLIWSYKVRVKCQTRTRLDRTGGVNLPPASLLAFPRPIKPPSVITHTPM